MKPPHTFWMVYNACAIGCSIVATMIGYWHLAVVCIVATIFGISADIYGRNDSI